MGRRRARRPRPYDRASRIAMGMITIVVCVLFAVLLFHEIGLKQRIRHNDEIREELTEQIQEEEKRKESILSQKEYMETDEYIKEVARNSLGLVGEDDIILKRREP
ncbi:MAG: septum formation initiator family protein [Lachnospiraceae bacterium]|nr:septum formation initiator family protein [Lachnospiraceae bacterium]